MCFLNKKVHLLVSELYIYIYIYLNARCNGKKKINCPISRLTFDQQFTSFCMQTNTAKQIGWQRHRHGEANLQTKRRNGEVSMQIFNLSLRKHDSDSCSVYSTYLVTVMGPSTIQITPLLSQLMYNLFVISLSLAFKNLFFFHNFLSQCCKQTFYSNITVLHGNLIFERPTSKTEAILLSLSSQETRYYSATKRKVAFQNFTYPSFMTIPIPLDIVGIRLLNKYSDGPLGCVSNFATSRILYTKIREIYFLGVNTAGS